MTAQLNSSLVVQNTIVIHADPTRVWSVLTDPRMIREYMYGAETVTDWRVGSTITFRGEFQGQAWEDHGVIQENTPHRRLRYSYWSGFCGLEDRPDNYAMVSYDLTPTADGTRLIVLQQGYASEESRQNSDQGWSKILSEIKNLAEQPAPVQ